MSESSEGESIHRGRGPRPEGREPPELGKTDITAMAPLDAQRLVHELETHQIELELQNEELRRAQVELAETRDRLTSLFEFAPVGYVTLDDKGCIVEANLTAAHVLRRDRAYLIGRRFASFVAPESQDAWYLSWRQAREVASPSATELSMSRPGADPFAAQLDFGTGSRDSEATRNRAADRRITITDISDRKRRELLEHRVHELERQESLGVMAGGIAHDFNNLLTAILGHSELAEDLASGHRDIEEHLRLIREAATGAAELSNQLLAYAREGIFHLEPVDVTAFLTESVELLRSALPAWIGLDVSIGPDIPPIRADGAQLRRVLLNLVSNAAEAYGSISGRVVVSASVRRCEGAYLRDAPLSSDLSPGVYVDLAVADQAGGMADAVADRIFEPFFSTKFSGRGLGLASAFGVVRGHLGALKLETTLGTGSCFHVLLPPSDRPVEAAPADPVDRGPALPRSGRVLVADDEPGVLGVLRSMLESLGFQVEAATTGDLAIATFLAAPTTFDLAVVDLVMPGRTGDEVLARLREARTDLPLVLCSGFDGEGRVATVLDRAGASFLAKPFSRSDLVAKIREASELCQAAGS